MNWSEESKRERYHHNQYRTRSEAVANRRDLHITVKTIAYRFDDDQVREIPVYTNIFWSD